jgi:hypothetical protein
LAAHFGKNGKRRRQPRTILYLFVADTFLGHFIEPAAKFRHERICVLVIRHDGNAVDFSVVLNKTQIASSLQMGWDPSALLAARKAL